MPRRWLFLLLWCVVSVVAATVFAGGFQMHSDEGPLPSVTGARAIGGSDPEANCTLCHQDFTGFCAPDPCNLNAPGGGVEILDLPAEYLPGQTYTLRVRLQSDSTLAFPDRLWGFELTSVRASDGAGVGDWLPHDPDTLQVVIGQPPFETRSYIEPTRVGTRLGLAGPVEWSFDWKAPSQNEGLVHFFAAGNAGNGNDQPDGADFVYTTHDSVPVSSVPVRATSWGGLKRRYR